MLIKGVQLLDRDPRPANITIRDGVITSVTRRSTSTADADALIFDSALAIPGLINAHDHLEFNHYPKLGSGPYPDFVAWGRDIHARYATVIEQVEAIPRHVRERAGLLKNLICGVTSVIHHGYELDPHLGRLGAFSAYTHIHSVRAAAGWRLRLNKPSKSALVALHLAEGTSAQSRSEARSLLRWHLRKDRSLIGVHGIALAAQEAANLAALVWCPESNLFLYGKTAQVDLLKHHTQILFGTDSTISADWDIWTHLRIGRGLALLTDQELINSVTIAPAKAFGLERRGAILPGYHADLVIIRADQTEPVEAFFNVGAKDILLVMQNGAIIFADASVDLARNADLRDVVIDGCAKRWAKYLDDWWLEICSYPVDPPFKSYIQRP